MLLHLLLTLHATEYHQAGVMDVHFSLFSLEFNQNFTTTTTKKQVSLHGKEKKRLVVVVVVVIVLGRQKNNTDLRL